MNHRIAQPAVGSITAGTAGRSAAPNPWLPWLGTPRYRCARPRWPWFRRPDRFWRYRRPVASPENLTLPPPSSLPVMAPGQIVILTLRIIRLRPLRHFQGDILTVLARGIRQRVLLDRGSAAPRSAGIGLGAREIQHGIRHGLQQFAGVIRQRHSVNGRRGRLRGILRRACEVVVP